MRRVPLLGLLALASCTPAENGTDGGSDAGVEPDAGVQPDGGWRSLFDGQSLNGWTRYLGSPADGGAPLGLENDPLSVFSVVTVDGEPAIHITGEVWGALVSTAEYENFVLEAEFKWGAAHHGLIDSGLMVLTTGPYGAVNAGGDALSNPIGSGAFQVSLEYQIAPGDVGGVYNLGPIRHSPGARVPGVELSGWNVIAVELSATQALHFLNGVQVASTTGFTLAWPGQPVVPIAKGRLQLQSEGGDIYFRRLRLRPR
jgi:hypothetical protein